jgi:thioredoxin-dependent peroxiredoxin
MSTPTVTFKGNKISLLGEPVQVGELLPKFKVTGTDLGDISNETFQGKVLLISVVPSLDTPVCSMQTQKFNQEATKLSEDVVILTVSLDLPFAQKRWCGAEGATRVIPASDYKYRVFGEAFGVYIQEIGLLTRAVFVADKSGKIAYVEYVSDVGNEPDYSSALQAVIKSS